MAPSKQDAAFFEDCCRGLLAFSEVQSMRGFLQHGCVSTLEHSLSVAWNSFALCRRLGLSVDERSLIRGALLHDFFLYDWHEKSCGPGAWPHGFTHPGAALQNASRLFQLTAREKNVIESHMWPLTLRKIPRCREAAVVCLVDKVCSIAETLRLRRPGAGYEPRWNSLIRSCLH